MTSVFSGQLLQQRVRLLQIFRVKPFSKPAVDFCQHLPRFVAFAVLLPQASKTRRRPQFQRLRLLLAGDFNGFEETGFGFRLPYMNGW